MQNKIKKYNLGIEFEGIIDKKH